MSEAPVKLEWKCEGEDWTATLLDGRIYRVFQQVVRNQWVCTVRQLAPSGVVHLNFVGVGDTADEAKALAQRHAEGGAQ